MNSIVNLMGKYDHRQHELSDWLAELEQRFQLGQVEADRAKITWCQLLIGATGSSILASLEDGATWEAAKETLLSRLGAGSVRDEAWASLKQLKRGSKEIIELAGEAEKLAKRLHPRDEEAAERHEVDAFLDALDRPLAAEVQKLGGRTMEEVVSAARKIERILHERPTSGMEHLMESMQSQIQILTKDLAKAHEWIAAQPPAATPTTAFAAPPSNTVAAAQHPPASLAPPQLSHPAATPLPPMATAQPPPYHLGQPQYFDFGESLHTFGDRDGSWTEGHCGASSVTRKATSHTAVLPDLCCSACCGNRHMNKPDGHPGVKSWNSLQPMVTPAPLRCI